jgi:hypothetical protein
MQPLNLDYSNVNLFSNRIKLFVNSNQEGEFKIIKKLFKQYQVNSIEREYYNSDTNINYTDGVNSFVWTLKTSMKWKC